MTNQKVIELIGSLNTGGAETLVKDYCLLMDKEKFEPIVVIADNLKGFANERLVSEAGIRIISLNERLGWQPSTNLLTRIYRKLARLYFFRKEMTKILQEERPVAVHVHLSLLQYLPLNKYDLCKNINFAYTCHSLPKYFFAGRNTFERFVAKRLLKDFKFQLIALHEDMKRELDAMFGISNTLVVNNGIDFNRFRHSSVSKEDMRKVCGVPSDAFVVGHVGRLSDQKNHKKLIEVFNEVVKLKPNAFLVMVGSGPLEAQIKGRLKDLGLEDRYILLQNRSDIPEILNMMDVFLFPSLYEGLSVVMVEAQASGLPCVISNTINEKTILTDHVVALGLDESPRKWAEVVISGKISNGGKHGNLDDFDMNKIIRTLEKVYAGE